MKQTGACVLMVLVYIAVNSMLMVGCSNSGNNVAGTGSSTGNAIIIGTVRDSTGKPAQGCAVYLIKNGYNPLFDELPKAVYTDSKGMYRCSVQVGKNDTVLFNIQAIDQIDILQSLIQEVAVSRKSESVAVNDMVLQSTGTITVVMQDTIDTTNASIFIPGTLVCKKVSNSVEQLLEHFLITIPKVPAAAFREVFFGRSTNPKEIFKLTDSVLLVQPGDTVHIDVDSLITIKGAVRTVDGKPAAGAIVALLRQTRTPASGDAPLAPLCYDTADGAGCFAFDDIDASYRYSLHAWNASLSEVCFLETLPQERNENGFNVVLTLARPGAVAIMLPLETAVRDELYFIRNTLITSRQRTTITTLSDHHEVCIGGVAPGYFQGVASLKNENSADRSQPLSGPITITAGDTVQVGWYMRQWTYTSRNSGLPTDKVLVIAQDETGSKWFLTEKNSAGRISRKLCHFDDAAWYMHTTSNGEIPQINTMSFDSDNTLWCGTQQNILKVKQPTQIMAFLSFQTAYTPIVDVTAIRFPRDSGAWIATNGFGAAFVTDGQTVSYTNVNSGLPSNFITACGVDDNNNAWFATSAGAACLTAAGVWNVYTQTNSGLPSDDLTGLCVTEDNTVWVGAGQAGAAFFDGNTWHSYQSNNSLLNGNRIVSMVVDTAQTVWFGLDCGAVVTFNGSVWKRYDHTNSKMVPPDKSGAVVSMFVDEGDNSVWVAMQNSGIVVFKEWKKW